MTSFQPDLDDGAPSSLRFRVGFGDADTAVLHLFGELDCSTDADVSAALQAIEMVGLVRVDVDVHELDFIDCAGLAVLREFSQRFAIRGGRLRIVRPSPAVVRLLAASGDQTLLAAD